MQHRYTRSNIQVSWSIHTANDNIHNFVKCSVRNVCNVYVKQPAAHLKCGVCWARRPVIILYQQHRWPVPPQGWWSSERPVTRPLTKSHYSIPTSTSDLTQVIHCGHPERLIWWCLVYKRAYRLNQEFMPTTSVTCSTWPVACLERPVTCPCTELLIGA